MNDSRNLGLDQLGRRVQAMADPVGDPYSRSSSAQSPPDPAPKYQGSPLPIGPPSSRSAPSYESFEDLRDAAPLPSPTAARAFRPAPAVSAATNAAEYGSGYAAVEFRRAERSPVNGTEVNHAATNYAGPNFANPTYNGSHYGGAAQPQVPPVPAAAPAALGKAPATASLPAQDPNAPRTGLHRVLNAVRSTLPLVQRLLPLLDGNFATAIGALVAPQLGHHPVPLPPPVTVDLEPVERGLAELRASQRDLRGQVLEQNVSLQRVEDQLERVREATDRNTLEQQELVEDLRSVGSRVSNLAIIGLVLLGLSVAVNVYFLVQLQHILR
jgi:hypothetical protein